MTMPFPSSRFTDVQTLRERARRHFDEGAVTDEYAADREAVIGLLNTALATEIVCALRYKRHYHSAKGLAARSVAQEFLEHADEEWQHADWFAERITQLGGEPDFSPATLVQRSHAEYDESDTMVGMIKEDLIAERIAIESYKEIIDYLGASDPTTRRLFEQVLAVEEEHAEDLHTLIHMIGTTHYADDLAQGGGEDRA